MSFKPMSPTKQMWLHKCAKDTDEYEQGRKILTVPDVSKTFTIHFVRYNRTILL
jgi:hypothetical protein